MSTRPIRLFGDPVLRTAADPVVDFDQELRTLVQDLTDTMLEAPGSGLAAPQIGVGLRVFTWHVDGELGHLVNPQLTLSEEIQDGPEGCLSIPGFSIDCKRALSVVAHGFDEHGRSRWVVAGLGQRWARRSSTRRKSPLRHPLPGPARTPHVRKAATRRRSARPTGSGGRNLGLQVSPHATGGRGTPTRERPPPAR